jgi:hypothetical protein
MSRVLEWCAPCSPLCHDSYFAPANGGNHLLHPLGKPATGLQEGALFCVFLLRDAEVAADGKAVLDAAVEIDLVGLLDFLEDDFGLVAFLGCEDGVGFWRRRKEGDMLA